MVIFDVETTGFILSAEADLKHQPKIIEIYAMAVDDDTLAIEGELDLLIDPGIEISAEITGITSITNEMVKGQGSFASHLPTIAEFWRCHKWSCGHNVTFDLDMLEIELRRLGAVARFPWSPNRLCTVELSEHYEGRRMKLIDLHRHLLGEGFESAHRARADVEATYRCLVEMHKQGDVPSLT